jgi:hypothetical protein
MNKASIIFTLDGKTYEYDGGLPAAVLERAAALLTPEGFWVGGYPAELAAAGADAQDELPTARWEIEHVGGTVLEVRGARDNGAIHLEDWKQPRIY